MIGYATAVVAFAVMAAIATSGYLAAHAPRGLVRRRRR